MPKFGILHDYDLMANNEPSAKGQTCLICDVYPVVYQWSDLNGEAMCRQCGTPYQLKNGSDSQIKEGNYPYLNLDPEWLPIIREYWLETQQFTHFGLTFGPRLGVEKFTKWVDKNHPEMAKESKEDKDAPPKR